MQERLAAEERRYKHWELSGRPEGPFGHMSPLQDRKSGDERPLKTAWFIRHGDNMPGVDEGLTEKGQKEAKQLVKAHMHGESVEVILVSPMMRAMHTAVVAFGPTANFVLDIRLKETTGMFDATVARRLLTDLKAHGMLEQYEAMYDKAYKGYPPSDQYWMADQEDYEGQNAQTFMSDLANRTETKIAMVGHCFTSMLMFGGACPYHTHTRKLELHSDGWQRLELD